MGLFEDIVAWITQYVVAPAISLVKDWVKWTFVTLPEFLNGVLNKINSWWTSTLKVTWDWLNTTVTKVKTFIDVGYTTLSRWWSTTLGELWNAIEGAVDGVRNFVIDSIDNIWEALNDAWTQFTDWVGTVAAAIYHSIEVVRNNLVTMISNAVNELTRTLSTLAATLWAAIETAVRNAAAALTSAIAGVTAFVNTLAAALWAGINKVWADTSKAVSDAFSSLTKYVNDTASSTIKVLKDWVPGAVSAMFEWAKPIVKPIIDAVGLLTTIVDIVSGVRPETPEEAETKTKITQLYDEVKTEVRKW